MQMVGIAQNDLGSRAFDFGGMKAPHGAVSTHRHERRSTHLAMRQCQRAGAGETVGAVEGEVEHGAVKGKE